MTTLCVFEAYVRTAYNEGRHGAGVAKQADARDSKSRGPKGPCGFDSHPRHQDSPTTPALRILPLVSPLNLVTSSLQK